MSFESYEEVITAEGHQNVTATHSSTLEITSDDWLTQAGDCIIGVNADRVPADFDAEFVRQCQSRATAIEAHIHVDTSENESYDYLFKGRGDPALSFDNERSHVGRTSEYVDDRTVFVASSGAAADIDERIIDALSAGATLTCRLRAYPERLST
jgi:hypothetical protein